MAVDELLRSNKLVARTRKLAKYYDHKYAVKQYSWLVWTSDSTLLLSDLNSQMKKEIAFKICNVSQNSNAQKNASGAFMTKLTYLFACEVAGF